MPDDVSSRILAAATLADKAANAQQIMLDEGSLSPELLMGSGPSHWGAVAAGFRALVAMHDRYWAACSVGEHHCRYGYLACESLNELLPLVDQIIRDLGDGQ